MKCNNCNEEMKMNYELKIHGASLLAYISLKKEKEEKQIKGAVCPNFVRKARAVVLAFCIEKDQPDSIRIRLVVVHQKSIIRIVYL